MWEYQPVTMVIGTLTLNSSSGSGTCPAVLTSSGGASSSESILEAYLVF